MTDVAGDMAEDSLRRVAEALRGGHPELTALATEPGEEPHYGPLTASGPRAEQAPDEYAFAIEAIREGYLLHYGRPRVAATDDPDLALLAGDFLYALGLEQIAMLGDSEAVAELAELISDCAAIHAREAASGEAKRLVEARWDASVRRIGGHPNR